MIDAQLLTLMHDTYHHHAVVKPGAHELDRGYSSAPSCDDIFAMSKYCAATPPQCTLPNESHVSQLYDQLQLRHGDYFRAAEPADSLGQRPSVIRDVQANYAYDTEGETCDSESEDDFMDDEYEEDECDYEGCLTANCYGHTAPDDPSQLLNFVCAVTADIQSLFSRNKDSEDFCDVYEERFKSTLSGRELYYADLLALASNGDAGPSNRKRSKKATTAPASAGSFSSSTASSPAELRAPEHTIIYGAAGDATVCTLPHEGRCIAACGLGPLEELFRKNNGGGAWKSPAGADFSHFAASTPFPAQEDFRTFGSACRNSGAVPMTMRKLPNSFWEEPGHGAKAVLPTVDPTPDFNDLFTHWST